MEKNPSELTVEIGPKGSQLVGYTYPAQAGDRAAAPAPFAAKYWYQDSLDQPKEHPDILVEYRGFMIRWFWAEQHMCYLAVMSGVLGSHPPDTQVIQAVSVKPLVRADNSAYYVARLTHRIDTRGSWEGEYKAEFFTEITAIVSTTEFAVDGLHNHLRAL